MHQYDNHRGIYIIVNRQAYVTYNHCEVKSGKAKLFWAFSIIILLEILILLVEVVQ